MKFAYTIVYVSSVTESLSFYKEAFGFETRFLHESKQYGEFETGATVLAFASHAMGEINLEGNYQKTDPSTTPLGVELAFITDDVASSYAQAVAAGAQPLKVVLFDMSAGMRAVAKEKTAQEKMQARVAFKAGDMLSLPFEDNSFDVVLSTYSLCPVCDPAKAAM